MTLSISSHNKVRDLHLPSQINELRPDIWRSSFFISALLRYDAIAIKVAIFRIMYPEYDLTPVQMDTILQAWDFKLEHSASTPLPTLSPYYFMDAAWPAPDFANGTLREFIYMDEYLQEGDLLKLTACLCRPVDRATSSAWSRDDKRVRLVSRMQVDHYASIIARYESSIIMRNKIQSAVAIAMSVAIGIKQLVSSLYSATLFTSSDDSDAAPSHNLGWTAIAMQVGDSRAFGNYEDVLDTTLHEICAYLVIKKQENDRMKALQNSSSHNP